MCIEDVADLKARIAKMDVEVQTLKGRLANREREVSPESMAAICARIERVEVDKAYIVGALDGLQGQVDGVMQQLNHANDGDGDFESDSSSSPSFADEVHSASLRDSTLARDKTPEVSTRFLVHANSKAVIRLRHPGRITGPESARHRVMQATRVMPHRVCDVAGRPY